MKEIGRITLVLKKIEGRYIECGLSKTEQKKKMEVYKSEQEEDKDGWQSIRVLK